MSSEVRAAQRGRVVTRQALRVARLSRQRAVAAKARSRGGPSLIVAQLQRAKHLSCRRCDAQLVVLLRRARQRAAMTCRHGRRPGGYWRYCWPRRAPVHSYQRPALHPTHSRMCAMFMSLHSHSMRPNWQLGFMRVIAASYTTVCVASLVGGFVYGISRVWGHCGGRPCDG